jgi:hypothetical protein|nr:MAG TPA: hypothetical protein [Caudoviricetes sp.]
MRELFVDASSGYPKCYWKDSRCEEGKWFRIKTGPDKCFLSIALVFIIIGLLFYIFTKAGAIWCISITIFFLLIHTFIYPHPDAYAVLEKSKKIKDILIENSPIYITSSKRLGSICFIIPDKKHMLFKPLRYGDDRLESTSSGWYIYKNYQPCKIDSKYFQEPIKDLKSKLDYRCDLSDIITLDDSPSNMTKVLKAMKSISSSIFEK